MQDEKQQLSSKVQSMEANIQELTKHKEQMGQTNKEVNRELNELKDKYKQEVEALKSKLLNKKSSYKDKLHKL